MSTKRKLAIGCTVCVLLAILLTIICVPVSHTKDEDRFVYELQNNSYIIKDIKNDFRDGWFGKKKLVVPATHKKKKVVAIEKIKANSLSELVISEGIETLSNNALASNKNMAQVTLPNSLKKIGANAFANTGLTSITIPSSVTSIEDTTFSGCTALESVTLPNSVTSIGNNVFESCTALKNITIPNSVVSIGNSAFTHCAALSSITIPSSITNIADNTFSGCTALESVTIPNSVTKIGNSVFETCKKLASIVIPNSVTSIGNSAFNGCSELANITLPTSLTSIKSGAFENTAYYDNSDNWEDNVLYISKYLIKTNSNLESTCTIKDGTVLIADGAFSGCDNLESITIPDSVTSIGNNTFSGCSKLESITLPVGITSIGSSAFNGCKALKKIQYGGTMAQWEVIVKDTDWNKDMDKFTVHCTDGDIVFEKEDKSI